MTLHPIEILVGLSSYLSILYADADRSTYGNAYLTNDMIPRIVRKAMQASK